MFKVSISTTGDEWYFPNIALAFFFAGSFFEKEMAKIISEDTIRIAINDFLRHKENFIEFNDIAIERIDY